jgi:hypothetical protein
MIKLTGLTGDLKRIDRIASFGFGVILVTFLSLLSAGINSSTNAINLAWPGVTIARSASIGLGTGYYLGATLCQKESSLRWVFLGVFSAVTIGSAAQGGYTLVNSNYNTVYELIIPTSLIILGSILSILAHFTPAIQNHEPFKKWFKFISGFVSTIVVTILAALEHVLIIISTFTSWLSSLTTPQAGFLIAIIMFISASILWAAIKNTSETI